MEIKVREKAQKGQANKRVFEILSFYFRIPKSKIRLIKGFRTRNKIFEIRKPVKSKQNPQEK